MQSITDLPSDYYQHLSDVYEWLQTHSNITMQPLQGAWLGGAQAVGWAFDPLLPRQDAVRVPKRFVADELAADRQWHVTAARPPISEDGKLYVQLLWRTPTTVQTATDTATPSLEQFWSSATPWPPAVR